MKRLSRWIGESSSSPAADDDPRLVPVSDLEEADFERADLPQEPPLLAPVPLRPALTRQRSVGEEPLRVTGPITTGTTQRLLSALARGRRHGKLTLTNVSYNIQLEILPEAVVVLNAGNPRHRLGVLAVQEKLLSEQQLLTVLKRQSVDPGQSFLGRLLLERSLVGEPALRWLLHLQAKRVFEDARGWEDGFFTFEEDPNRERRAGDPVMDPRMHLDRFANQVG